MICKTTLLNVILAIALALIYASMSRVAYGATPSDSMGHVEGEKRAYEPSARSSAPVRVSIEVKPVPALMTVIPGTIGYGVEAEAVLGGKLGLATSHTRLRQRLSDATLAEMQSDHPIAESIPFEVQSASLGAALRYYDRPDDTWYAGMRGGIARSTNRWAFGDERYEDRFDSYLLGFDVGYRWTWDSGFLVRAGIGGTGSYVPRHDLASVASVRGQRAVDAEVERSDPTGKAQIRPTIDFGLGYRF